MNSFLQRNREFWNHERSLRALLVYMSISIFAWIPLADYSNRWWGFLISDMLFNLIILAGVFSVLTRWKKQLLFISIAFLTSLLRLLSFLTQLEWIQLAGYVFAIMSLHIWSLGHSTYF